MQAEGGSARHPGPGWLRRRARPRGLGRRNRDLVAREGSSELRTGAVGPRRAYASPLRPLEPVSRGRAHAPLAHDRRRPPHDERDPRQDPRFALSRLPRDDGLSPPDSRPPRSGAPHTLVPVIPETKQAAPPAAAQLASTRASPFRSGSRAGNLG